MIIDYLIIKHHNAATAIDAVTMELENLTEFCWMTNGKFNYLK
jgi:hypothetical protein